MTDHELLISLITSASHAGDIGEQARHSPDDLVEFRGALKIFHGTLPNIRQRIGAISQAIASGQPGSDPRPIARDISVAIHAIVKILPVA